MANSFTNTQPTPATKRQPAHQPRFIRNLGIYLVLGIGAAVAIVPFLYTISVSLMNLTEASGGAWYPGQFNVNDWSPRFLQWGNYAQAWEQANFSDYFWNSVQIAVYHD